MSTVRRALFWIAGLAAAIALCGGSAFALIEHHGNSGPASAVEGYFAALARSDAPAALAYGAVPDGPHDLLTSPVLAEQQRLAPLHDVRIKEVVQDGSRATVHFSYLLGTARARRHVSGAVGVVEQSSGWRLAESAVATTVTLDQAADRISFAGVSVPDGRTLVFPGMLPIRFDTPYLRVRPGSADVWFGGPDETVVQVEATAAARVRLTAEVDARLKLCVSGAPAALSCPLPSGRFVPGSLRGRIVGGTSAGLTFRVGAEAAGTIETSGTVGFIGRYRRLAYDNVASTHVGPLQLPVSVTSYAVAPLSVHFSSAT